jgi:hypothetical protein
VGAKKDVKMGDTVTREGLGVSEEAWNDLVEANVVRTIEPPKMEGFSGSVVEWYAKQAREASLKAGNDAETAALEGFHSAAEVG